MSLSNLRMTFAGSVSGNVGSSSTSQSFPGVTADLNPSKSISYKTGTGASQGNDLLGTIVTVSNVVNMNTVTIDLTNFTNVVGQTGSFARIKSVYYQLLSVSDDSVNGTACSSVTIGAAISDPNPMFLSQGYYSFTLLNGDFVEWGTQSATGVLVQSNMKNITITNNDSSNPAAVVVCILGADS